jgi:UDP-N-acetyl-D-glucosamine dehydrogenase
MWGCRSLWIVTYSDPHVPTLRMEGLTLEASPEETAAQADCAVIVTDHSTFDYKGLVDRAPLIVDTWNALRDTYSDKIVRLSADPAKEVRRF